MAAKKKIIFSKVFKSVIEIAKTVYKGNFITIYDNTNLVNKSDDMAVEFVEFIMMVENKFNIAIPDEIAESLNTPRKITYYIIKKLNK